MLRARGPAGHRVVRVRPARHAEVAGNLPNYQAVADLHERHYRGLTQLAALLSTHRAVAEQIAQDAFAALYQVSRRLDSDEAALLYLRRQIIRRARSGEPRRRGSAWPAEWAGETPPAVRALAALPIRQREAVVLRCWADLSYAQIAAVTGGRPRTVARELALGLTALGAGPHGADVAVMTRPDDELE